MIAGIQNDDKMKEQLAWLAGNLMDVAPYVLIAVVCFYVGGVMKHCADCTPSGPPVIADAVQSLIKVKAEDVTNMSQSPGLCDINGTPIIRMFSTSWCPHCIWAGPAFDELAADNAGKAIFEHVDVETGDNSLTLEVEKAMTPQDYILNDQFGKGSVPLYVFGCEYYRVGNVFETAQDLTAEKNGFQQAIELVTG